MTHHVFDDKSKNIATSWALADQLIIFCENRSTAAKCKLVDNQTKRPGWNGWTAMGEVDEQERTTSQAVRDLPCYLLSVCLTTSLLQFLEVVKELAKDRIQV